MNIEARLEQAWSRVNDSFPWEGYIHPGRKSGYFEMVRKVDENTGPQPRIFDFGAGPCDKTAMFALCDMDVTAYDDLNDAWHLVGDNRQKILDFAAEMGINYRTAADYPDIRKIDTDFDVVMAHDVLEHFHSSPRVILNHLLQMLKPEGLLVLTLPNAGNVRKRIDLLRGKTNYPRFPYYYWYPGEWRGHVREYVRNDLERVNEYLSLEKVSLHGYSLQLDALPPLLRRPFDFLTAPFEGLRDSWMLIARKPAGWVPCLEPTQEQFVKAYSSQYYKYRREEIDWSS